LLGLGASAPRLVKLEAGEDIVMLDICCDVVASLLLQVAAVTTCD